MLTATETLKKASFLDVQNSINESVNEINNFNVSESIDSLKDSFYKQEFLDAKPYIDLYNTNYVNCKFLLPHQVQKICVEYDLYQRSVTDYIGKIPKKNAKDIKQFKININDIDEEILLKSIKYCPTAGYKFGILKHIINFFSTKCISDIKNIKYYDKLYYGSEKEIEERLRLLNFNQPEIFSNYLVNDKLKTIIEDRHRMYKSLALGIHIKNDINFYINSYLSLLNKYELIHKGLLSLNNWYRIFLFELTEPLFTICATKDCFTNDSMIDPNRFLNYDSEQKKTNFVGSIKYVLDYDPIVLFKVNGGYLVITAWGEESKSVINEKLN
jgi:hypothetical protein